ncbi:MAG: hypothetical protein JWM80_6562 [Cyanobacteria bacterium RYN_339]|nr:hypothetical protein [Cyanobacteria bacterium RYN_339]
MQHDAWILASKLAPPAPPARWLERGFLPAGAPRSPVTWLVGGSGYGKTLGLLALAGDAPRVWLALDDLDVEPATLFYYLVAGMRAHVPAFGEAIHATLQAGGADPRQLWQAFAREVAGYNMPALVVAIDDVHHLPEEVLAPLATLAGQLPPGLQLLLAGRQRPPKAFARARAAGHVTVIDSAQLAFNADDQRAFLAGREPTSPGWEARLAALEGWPLGLDLLIRQVDELATEDLVAAEFYGSQPPARREFMLQASFLAEITAEACAWIFQGQDAALHLAELEAAQLILRLASSGAYRFPAYLLAFLRQDAGRSVPSLAAAAWHRRAATYYMEADRAELALPHLVASRDWPAAAAACQATFPAMRYSGRQGQIARTLASFPADVREEEPALLLWGGHAHSRAGRPTEARDAYDRAARGFHERDDGAGEFKVLVRLVTLAMRRGDTASFNQLVLQALARLPEGSLEDVVDLQLARAAMADFRGDAALMRECNEAALAIAGAGNAEIAASHVIANLNLYTAAFHAGELTPARGHAEQALAIAREHGMAPYMLYATCLLAHLDLTTGEVEAAGATLRGLPDDWEARLDWHMRAVGQTILGAYHLARGEAAESQAAYDRSLASFDAVGYAEGRKLPLEGLMWLALQRNLPTKAIGYFQGGGRNYYDLALALPHARAVHLAGDPAAASVLLRELAETCEQEGAALLAVRARLYLAAATGAACPPLEALGYGFLRGQDARLWQELAPAATGDPALDLACFGGLQVRREGVLLDHWPRRKAKLILAAMVLHPEGVRQTTLAEWLGDGDEGSGVAILRMSLRALRGTLEPDLAKGAVSRYVKAEGDLLVLDRAHLGSCDLQAFDEALTAGDGRRDEAPVAAAAHYERALALYQGDLFDETLLRNFFEEERNARRERAAAALAWLAAFHGERGDRSGAEAALRRAVATLPAEEWPYLALMRHQHAAGRPELARQAYWDCRKALKQHLDATPSEAFEVAAQAMR